MTTVSCMPDSNITFSQQSELWLDSLKTRKRKPVSPATLRVFGSYVRRLTPTIGEMKLVDITNGVLRELVQKLDAEKLSAKTVNELVAVVKQVVASLVDENTGEPMLKREWSARFIDCPTVANQKQPCLTREDVERCIKNAASDQERVLHCVLAGSGLRIAEALAIHINGQEDQTSWSPQDQAISVRSSIFSGCEIPRLKTAAAKRTVDLDPALSDLIARFIELYGIQPGDYLFEARSGRPMHLKTARERLAKHNVPGFHSFRRHRITWLRERGVREDIIRYWAGHVGSQEGGYRQSITDRYSKLGENVELRRDWVLRAGLGFALPEIGKAGRPEPSARSPRTAKCDTSHAPVKLAESSVASYQASDDDLPAELFAAPSEHSECA